MRKILSWLLVAVMVVGMLPTVGFAAEGDHKIKMELVKDTTTFSGREVLRVDFLYDAGSDTAKSQQIWLKYDASKLYQLVCEDGSDATEYLTALDTNWGAELTRNNYASGSGMGKVTSEAVLYACVTNDVGYINWVVTESKIVSGLNDRISSIFFGLKDGVSFDAFPKAALEFATIEDDKNVTNQTCLAEVSNGTNVFSYGTAGNDTLTVEPVITFGDGITVPKTPEKIDAVAKGGPSKKWFVGDSFDKDDLTVTVTYDDDSSDELDAADFELSGPATLAEGNNVYTVTYGQLSDTVTITAQVLQVERIEITQEPSNKVFTIDDSEPAEWEDMVVTLVYENNKTVPTSDYTVTGFDSSSAGKKTMTVSYNPDDTKTDTFKITVNKKANTVTFTDSIDSVIAENDYTFAATATGGSVKIEYSADGESWSEEKPIAVGNYTVRASVSGDATYADAVATHQFEIIARVVTDIKLTAPTKTQYVINQTLDTTGMKVMAVYNDGDEESVDVKNLTITGFNSSNPVESQTVSVTYAGKTKTFTVKITALPLQNVSFAQNAVSATYGDTGVANVATNEQSGAITYSSENEDIATVDANGAVTIKAAGEVKIKATAAAVEGYAETTVSYTLTVAPKEVTPTVTIIDGPYVYNNGEEVKASFTVKLDGEDMDEDEYEFGFSHHHDAGTAYVVITDAEGGNYKVKDVDEPYTIEKAAAKTLGDQNVSVKYTASLDQTYTLTGLGEDITGYAADSKTGDDIIDSWSVNENGVVSFKLKSGITAGQTVTMKVEVSYKNYNNSFVNVVVNITDRDPSNATVDATFTKTYDGTAVTIADIHATAGVKGTWTWNTEAPVNAQTATTYALTFTPDDQVNYAVETKNVSITINPAKITVKADDKTAKIGDVAPALTYTVSGLCGSDELGGTVVVEYENVPDMSKVGTVNIIVSGAKALTANYVVEHVNGVLEIVAKSNTVTPVGPSKDKEEEPGEVELTMSFADVTAADWFYDTIKYTYENGLMNGVSEDNFAPYANTSRSMLVTILWRLEGKPAPLGNCQFVDVPAGAWYAEAVTWAAEKGIVTGLTATEFGPDANITREQFATILYRYAKNYKGYDVSVGEDTNILSYTDAMIVSEYAIPAMQWACGAGLINGIDGALQPAGFANRAQAATILARFCQNYQ